MTMGEQPILMNTEYGVNFCITFWYEMGRLNYMTKYIAFVHVWHGKWGNEYDYENNAKPNYMSNEFLWSVCKCVG